MAKGLPDWTKDLRPQQGSVYNVVGNQVVSPGDTDNIVSIAGKGIILGGFLHSAGNAELGADDEVSVHIDGVTTGLSKFSELYEWNVYPPHGHYFTLTKYDNVEYNYALSIGQGLSYDDEFILKFNRYSSYSNVAVVLAIVYYTDIIG